MKERTEDDILSRAPVKVMLGVTEYNITPLTMLKARAWRAKLTSVMSEITTAFSAAPTTESVSHALTSALISFPEKLAELVFEYNPELPKDTVIAEATEEQIVHAFSVIMNLAFPYLGQLNQTLKVMKASL